MPEMTIEEALSHLQVIDHDFYMFRNIETSEINVIYERNHNGYGVIQPRKNGKSNNADPAEEMTHVLGAMDL